MYVAIDAPVDANVLALCHAFDEAALANVQQTLR